MNSRLKSPNQRSDELARMLDQAHIIDLAPYKSFAHKLDELFLPDQSSPDRAVLCVAGAWGYWSRAYGSDIRAKQSFINAIAGMLENSG